jgi:hypothetical protein
MCIYITWIGTPAGIFIVRSHLQRATINDMPMSINSGVSLPMIQDGGIGLDQNYFSLGVKDTTGATANIERNGVRET